MPVRSSGVPWRLIARLAMIGSMNSLGTTERAAAVSIGPGAMELTRMFIPPSS